MRTPGTCLILGSGMGGLALGALLARAGVEVTILEAHPESIGGWAHTLHVNGYKFAAGPRYLWGFGPSQIGQRFLEKCALTERVPMVEFDRRGFDHIYVGDDEPIRVPNGWSEYEELLKERFPGEAQGIRRFFSLCRTTFQVIEILEENGRYLEPWSRCLWSCFLRRPGATAQLLLHRHLTLHQAFETCRLSNHLRTVLYAHRLIFVLPPETLSFHAYAAATLLYHRGCWYPRDDMAGLVGAVADTIERHKGRILCGQRVVSVRASGRGIEGVKTQTGECFAADVVVVNFDPKTFLAMVEHPGGTGALRLPPYDYSHSLSSLFLGIRDARILGPRFGKWNIWYCSGTDPAPTLCNAHPDDEPRMLYLNSATLVTGQNNDAPPGHASVTCYAPCGYQVWKTLDLGKPVSREKHVSRMVDVIERRFVPGLKGQIEVAHLQTPEDKERALLAPAGNIYGRRFDARGVWTKIPFKGLLPNLYFVGAYVSFPGIPSVIYGACRLYEELTGDRV